jgi:hypothetical protein
VYDAPPTTMWCRRRCPQPRMGHFWRFRLKRFVVWTHWHRRVAWFQRTRQGRQSERGRRSGDLGGQPRPVGVSEHPMWDSVQPGRRHRAARLILHDGGSLSPSGFWMGGPSLDAVQDCIFGRNYHGGALALRGRFPLKIVFSRRRDPGTKPTYGRPFMWWVLGYACPVPTVGSYRTVASLVRRYGWVRPAAYQLPDPTFQTNKVFLLALNVR